jgi:hypothetical protein
MTRALVMLGLVVATVVHLLPTWGVLSNGNIEQLYGVSVEGNDLQLLMRHRAVMFGILGMLALVALFRPSLRTVALATSLASLAAFLLLAWLIAPHGPEVARVVRIDVFAVIAVGAGLAARLWERRVSP